MEHENRRDGEDIASRVRGVISEVAQSLELGHWDQAVRDTAGSVLDEARRQMEQCRTKAGDAMWRRKTVGGAREVLTPKPIEIRVSWKGKVSGILLTVFGGLGSTAFGLPALGLLAAMATSVRNPIGWWIAGVCGAAALGFGGMLWAGISQNRRISRLKRYVEELKRHGKPYCEIEELSRSCVRSPGFVRRDLKKIMGLGMLPDVRMDKEGSWLLLDDETYRQFRLFEKAQEQKAQEQKDQDKPRSLSPKAWFRDVRNSREKKRIWESDTVLDGGSGEKRGSGEKFDGTEEGGGTADSPLEAAVSQGERYMSTLRQLRESMPGDPVDARLLRLETVLRHLFKTLKKYPEKLDEMERFMEYYLPTTVKLAESYREFAAVEFPGENVGQAKAEILQTLDTINGAFERLQDDLYQDAAFDVMTDASVLQTMLARDGMAETDFRK